MNKKRKTFKEQKEWSDKFLPLQQDIILKYKSRLDFSKVNKNYAFRYDLQKDLKQNTDILIYEYCNLSIALRVRDTDDCKWRDVTIRTYSNGYMTEYEKLMNGYGQYMLYCWGNDRNNIPTIESFILFDLDIFRQKHEEFIHIKDKNNEDGTRFNIYDTKKIIKTDCSIVASLS